MQHDAQAVGVRKHPFPLIQLAAIEAVAFVVAGIGPYVFAIAIDVERQEVNGIHAFIGQVVESADQPFAFATLPGRIAFVPVWHVVLIDVQLLIGSRFALALLFLTAKLGAVKILVAQQVLRTVGAALQKVFVGFSKP